MSVVILGAICSSIPKLVTVARLKIKLAFTAKWKGRRIRLLLNNPGVRDTGRIESCGG